MLIREGIDDITPVGLSAFPLEPGGLLVLLLHCAVPLELVLLLIGKELRDELWAAEAEFYVSVGKF